MSKEILEAVRGLAAEKNISAEKLMEALEDALLSAYKKTPGSAPYARVEMNRDTGDFTVWELKIPAELEEASMVDGLGRLGALTRITLPLAAPGIVTALIFTFISAWNEFLVALTLSLGEQTSQQPLTVAINQYIGEYSVDWGHLFAAGLVATVPVIILFAFIERRVVSGLTAGSVK